MPSPNHPNSANSFLANSFCLLIGVAFITSCFIFLSVAYNDVKTCSLRKNCNGLVETKAKVLRIVAAVVFMIGFAIITTFWWKLKTSRALNDYRQRIAGLQRMELELELGIFYDKVEVDIGYERNFG